MSRLLTVAKVPYCDENSLCDLVQRYRTLPDCQARYLDHGKGNRQRFPFEWYRVPQGTHGPSKARIVSLETWTSAMLEQQNTDPSFVPSEWEERTPETPFRALLVSPYKTLSETRRSSRTSPNVRTRSSKPSETSRTTPSTETRSPKFVDWDSWSGSSSRVLRILTRRVTERLGRRSPRRWPRECRTSVSNKECSPSRLRSLKLSGT